MISFPKLWIGTTITERFQWTNILVKNIPSDVETRRIPQLLRWKVVCQVYVFLGKKIKPTQKHEFWNSRKKIPSGKLNSNEKWTISRCISYQKWAYFIAMLVYWRVAPNIGWWTNWSRLELRKKKKNTYSSFSFPLNPGCLIGVRILVY